MSHTKNKSFIVDRSLKLDSESMNKRDRKSNKQLLKRIIELGDEEENLTDGDFYAKIEVQQDTNVNSGG